MTPRRRDNARLVHLVAGVAFAMAGSAITSGMGAAQSPEEFYRGRQVTFVIPVAAGGDYDLWGRMIFRHLGSHIPGHPNVLPQNMPGGGQLTAANHMFNVAARDGSVLGMIGRNLPHQALLRHPNVQFDPVRFNWIGSPELTNRVCGAMTVSGVTSGADLFQRDLLVGGAGANTAVSTTPLLLYNLLGMRFKLIEGYGSTNAIMLAMERGEVHGICQTYMGIKNGNEDWLISGRFKILFNMERTQAPGLNAPTIYEFVKTDEQRALIGFFNSSVELGRPLAAPPDVPADRVAALRRAFDATMRDVAFLAEAAQQRLEINALTGEQLAALVVDLMKTSPEISEKIERMTRR